MSKPACKSVERYKAHADENTDMSCCRATAVYMDVPQHDGPCCTDPDCGDCDPVLLMERVRAERAALLSALASMVQSYDLTQESTCPLGEIGKGVVRGYFFGARDAAGAAIEQAEGR